MVVDDDPEVLKLTSDVLTQEGYQVVSAATPVDALGHLTSDQKGFDLLLIDAVLPAMSGPELAEKMLVAQPDAKVLFMSGLDALAVTLAFGKPCESIQKPFPLKTLKAKVASMLSAS